MELYKKYRPKELSEVVGQPRVVNQVDEWTSDPDQEPPHAMLFSGPTGVGKTTVARILRRLIKCGRGDYLEMNSASCRGVDDVRMIERRMGMASMGGGPRMWVFDEAHKLTNDAQNALLKPLEDTPAHVYFVLCSSIPNKLLAAIKTRTTELKFGLISDVAVKALVLEVAQKESSTITEEVVDKLVDVASGSARKALVLLQQVYKLKNSKKQLAIIEKALEDEEGIAICRALFERKPDWFKIAKILLKLQDEPETVRRSVLGYARKVGLSNPKLKDRAFLIQSAFRDPYYDTGASGLYISCYEAVVAK